MTSNPSSTRLPVLVNINTNETYAISSASVSLGRNPDNDLVISDDGYVSAAHARIYYDQGAWWLEDLQSSNGTAVNDQNLSAPWRLSPGELIKIGRTVFRIE